MKQTHHIVYASDHNYIFPCAVSMLSLITYADPRNEYAAHLLIDDTLTSEDRELLSEITAKFPNFQLEYHPIQNEQLNKLDCSYTYLNKMTLYRLLLGEVLQDVDVCLYLDSDTLVCADISPLLQTELGNHILAGVKDDYVINGTDYCPAGLPDKSGYVNAGVLMMNLRQIRAEGLQERFFDQIKNQYLYNDQDILNICCYGRILHVDEKYNRFSFYEFSEYAILHFASQFGTRPWDYQYACFSVEWWDMAKFFEETTYYKECRMHVEEKFKSDKAQSIAEFLKQMETQKKLYIWGGGRYGRILIEYVNAGCDVPILGIIDNRAGEGAEDLLGIPVIPPDKMNFSEDTEIVISNQKEENRTAIKEQLLCMGIPESQIHEYYRVPEWLPGKIDKRHLSKYQGEILLERIQRETN